MYVYVLVAQSCPTLCDPIDYSWPAGHGLLQARILGWPSGLPFVYPADAQREIE